MNKDTEDHFKVLRSIQKHPKSSQRMLAKDLGFSLGKLNYCINESIKYDKSNCWYTNF